jgi:hypothetical protein
MTWYYQDQEVLDPPQDTIGFVYIIENLTNGRKYIGKKLFSFSKTTYKTIKLKNGTKKRKKIKGKIPSDWQDYYGSSVELSNDIALLGKENFKRQILYYCRSKAECSYIEAKLQFENKVLESADYYNNIIQVRIHGSHISKL